MQKKPNLNQVDLSFMDDEGDFDRVVSKIEIFTIEDPSIFEHGYQINGVTANIKHPDLIDEPNERWLDLRGDKRIYLKVTYDKVKRCHKPISDLNFYKISRPRQNPNKISIHVRQGIEPIPIKQFGDPHADSKIKKTKQIGAEGKRDDIFNFYGNYDLTSYFEDSADPSS